MTVAVISDIHGNRQALEAVLAEVADSSASQIWCLGDLVGYGADPDACIAGDRLQRHRPPVRGGECLGRHLEQLLPIAARIGPNTASQSGASSVSATVQSGGTSA